MQTRTVRAAPPDEPLVTDDPFADLLEDLQAEESLRADDDAPVLQRLFSEATRHDPPRGEAPPGSHWPGHNYGAAYGTLRRDRGVRRRPSVLSESDLWDVDQLTHEPHPEPVVEAPAPAPWRAPVVDDDPLAWLDTLDTPAVDPGTTEARLVDLVWGRPLHPTLFEATELLHARPRNTRAVRVEPAAKERLVPPTVKVAALAMVLLFALAVLQLLLS